MFLHLFRINLFLHNSATVLKVPFVNMAQILCACIIENISLMFNIEARSAEQEERHHTFNAFDPDSTPGLAASVLSWKGESFSGRQY